MKIPFLVLLPFSYRRTDKYLSSFPDLAELVSEIIVKTTLKIKYKYIWVILFHHFATQPHMLTLLFSFVSQITISYKWGKKKVVN
jgi:hypothetical protein